MGGFSIGEIFAALKLDDSQFQEAIKRSETASAAMQVNLNFVREKITRLSDEFRRAGFSMNEVYGYYGKIRSQGNSVTDSINLMTDALQRFQDRVRQVNSQKLNVVTTGLDPVAKLAEEARINELRRSILGKIGVNSSGFEIGAGVDATNRALQEINKQLSAELANYRALLEAERLRLKAVEDRIKSETNYKNLTNQLRKEQQQADEQLRAARAEAIAENDRILKPQRDAEAKHQADIAKLREQYTAQANAADLRAKTALEVQKTAIEKGAAARRASILNAEIAQAEATYAAEVAAANAAEKAKTLAARKGWLERLGIDAQQRQAIAQTAYLAGGRFGGHAASLSLLSPPIATGVGAGIGLAVAASEATEFDKVLTRATANMQGFTLAAKSMLGAVALQLSNELPIAATEVAKSFRAMIESGYDVTNSLKTMPVFAKFATGTLSDLDASIEHLTSAQKAFGLTSKDQTRNLANLTEVANVVVRLNELGGASALDYAKSLSAVGPMATKLGMSLRDAGAAVRVMALQNVDGSRAGEVLSRVLTVLTDAQEKNGSSWKQLGLTLYDGQNQLKPMSQIMDELSKHIGTADPKLNSFNTNLLGLDRRADKFVATLLKQNMELRNGTNALNDFGNALDRVAAKRMDNLADALNVTWNQIKNGAIEALTPTIEKVKVLVQLLNAVKLPSFMVKPLSSQNWLGGQTFGVPQDSPNFQLSNGKIKITSTPEANAAVQEQAKVTEEVVRSAERAREFNAKHSESLVVLQDELRKTNKLIKTYYDLLNDEKTADGVRDIKEPEYERLLAKRSEIESKIALIRSKLTPAQEGNTIESLRQKFMAFSDEYGRSLEQLDAKQQAIITAGAEALGDKFAKADMQGWTRDRVTAITNAYNDLEKQLRVFKADAAERERQENIRFSQENAEAAVKAFVDKYQQDLRALSPLEKEVMDSLTGNLQQMVAEGASPKAITTALNVVQKRYESIIGTIDNAVEVQERLNAAVRQWHQEQRGDLKQKPEFAEYNANPFLSDAQNRAANLTNLLSQGGFKNLNEYMRASGEYMGGVLTSALDGLIERILVLNPSLVELGQAFEALQAKKNTNDKSNALSALGIQSQELLDLAAKSTAIYRDEIIRLGGTQYEVHAAMVKAWEAEALAAHKAPEALSKSAKLHYRQYKAEVENNVIAANKRWQSTLQDIESAIRRTVSNLSRGLFDMLWPRQTDTRDKLGPLVNAFRDVYEQLSAYSDPKRALEGVIKAIQTAGTTAQANAIAVKYFGKEAGPGLARELRDGTIGAKDIAEAIRQATASTLDFANKSAEALNRAGELWRQFVRDITTQIAEVLIKKGFQELLEWVFKLGDTKDVGDALWQSLKKIGSAIKDIFVDVKDTVDIAVAAAKGAAVTLADLSNLPINRPNIPGVTTPDWTGVPGVGGGGNIPTGGGNIPTGGSSGGGVGSALGGFANTFNMITGAVQAIAGVFSAIGTMRLEGTMNAVEHNTRYLQIQFEQYLAEHYMAKEQLHRKLDDVWNEIRNVVTAIRGDGDDSSLNVIRDYTVLYVQKLDEFIIPKMDVIISLLSGGAPVNVPALAMGSTGGNNNSAGSGNVNIYGDITVQANSPERFVREMKSRRQVRGLR